MKTGTNNNNNNNNEKKPLMPTVEAVQEALSQAKGLDDFFGREGLLAQLFARTIEQMLEGELSAHLGYEKYETKGHNSGNSRNGKRAKTLHSSGGDVMIGVPRDRNGAYKPQLLANYQNRTNELEDKVIAMYSKGLTTRDIEEMLSDTYGVAVSAGTISTITDKVWPLVEEWQNRPLERIYSILYLDALHIKLRRDGKIENVAIYVVLGVNLDGYRDVLGHWVGDGAEGANFWLGVISDLQARGVTDVFIACVDGLSGFAEAIEAIFPKTQVQRCIIHQIRYSLKYVSWKHRKFFMRDLRKVYQAPTREDAELQLLHLGELWADTYPSAVRSWENNWATLSTFFDYPEQIRRLIYTTNTIEGYHRQLRKVTKTTSIFPSPKSVRKLLFLANERITQKWTRPIPNWALILNQLAIRFQDRMPTNN